MRLYKYTMAEFGLSAIRERKLKVTTIADANDPNEWLPVMRDPNTGFDWNADPEYRGQFRYRWSHVYGFVSFSMEYNNLLMWGHYADKFRGMVLVFNVLDESKVIKVDYQSSRFNIGTSEVGNPSVKTNGELIRRKDPAWGYEKEYRALINLKACTTKRLANSDTIYFTPFEPAIALIGVVLGSECTVTVEDIHWAFKQNPPIGFSIVQLAADSPTYCLVVSDHKAWNGVDWVSQAF